MTPQLADRLRIHEDERRRARRPRAAASPRPRSPSRRPRANVWPLRRSRSSTPPRSLLRREALHRRLLAVADVLAATLALVVVLSVLGQDQPGARRARRHAARRRPVQGRRPLRPRRAAARALDARRGAAAPAAHRPVRARRHDPPAARSSTARLGGGADRRALARRLRRDRRRADRSLARSPARLSPTERCLVDRRAASWPSGSARSSPSSRARAVVVATLPLAAEDVEALDEPEGVRALVHELQVAPHHHRPDARPTPAASPS